MLGGYKADKEIWECAIPRNVCSEINIEAIFGALNRYIVVGRQYQSSANYALH